VALKKNDLVLVRKGKDRGKKGKIIRVDVDKNRILVQGVNYQTVYTRASQQNPKGGITKVEATVHRANVQLVCPKCSKATKTGYQFLSDKTKQRICKKCSEII